MDAAEASSLLLKEDKKDSEKIVNLFIDTIFKDIDKSQIEKMVYSFSKGEARCGDILVGYDEVPPMVYFLMTGSAKVGDFYSAFFEEELTGSRGRAAEGFLSSG